MIGASSVCIGGSALFRVAAAGSVPLDYQWRRDGAPLADDANLSGALTRTLTVSHVGPALVGEYDCIVTNSCGNATSNPASLSLCPADFNCDAAPNSQDFFDFLSAYFANSPRADFNLDGAVTSEDFFDFLAAFLAGC